MTEEQADQAYGRVTEAEMVDAERALAESDAAERQLVGALIVKAIDGDRAAITALVERELGTYMHNTKRELRGWSQLYVAVRALLASECQRRRTHLSVIVSRQVQNAAGVAWQSNRERYWDSIAAAGGFKRMTDEQAANAATRHVVTKGGGTIELPAVRRRGVGRAS